MPTTPKVKKIRLNGLDVKAEFNDGRVMWFIHNGGGFGESTAMQTIRLDEGHETLVEYHSPHQHPRNTKGTGIQRMVQECGVVSFIAYLKAAMEAGRKNSDVWCELHKASKDLRDLERS